MKILALVLLAPATVLLAAEPPPANRLELWYDRPAVYWEEALPVGNGRIGAMVHGGVLREHIQLNEETIWSGAPTPAMSVPSFREVRRRTELLFAGRVRATEELKLSPAEIAALRLPAPELVPGTSSTRHVHQPLGDLYLHFDLGTAREENYPAASTSTPRSPARPTAWETWSSRARCSRVFRPTSSSCTWPWIARAR